jgi:hypothetical protein
MRMDAACPPGTDSAGSFSTNAWSVLLAIFITPRKGGWMLNGANFGAALGATDGATEGFSGAGEALRGVVLEADSVAWGLFETVLGTALRFGSGLDDGRTVAEVKAGGLTGGVADRTPGAREFWRTIDEFASLDGSDCEMLELEPAEVAGGIMVVF